MGFPLLGVRQTRIAPPEGPDGWPAASGVQVTYGVGHRGARRCARPRPPESSSDWQTGAVSSLTPALLTVVAQ